MLMFLEQKFTPQASFHTYIRSFLPQKSEINLSNYLTAQKMTFSIKDFFSKCDQSHRKRRIWSQLLKKSLMENLIIYAVLQASMLGKKTSKLGFTLYLVIINTSLKHVK